MRKQLCLMFVFLFGSVLAFASSPAEARAKSDRSRSDQAAVNHHGVKKQVRAKTKKYRITRSFIGHNKVRHTAKRRIAKGGGVSLAGVTPVLAAKARQIASACGSTIVSAVSRRGIRSNHPIGRAVDLRGNPRCIYAQLKGWPGGYSTDYGAAGHVHISYNPGGQEWGMRFAHATHGHGARRYAGLRNPGANPRVYARARAGANHYAKAPAGLYGIPPSVHLYAPHAPQ